jgi:hypothetical protein
MVSHDIESSKDGAVVCWDAGAVVRATFDAAYTKLGLGKLLPRRMKRATALRLAMSQWIAAHSTGKKKQRYDFNPLDRRVCGFEAVLQSKGDEKNLHAYQWTAKVNTSTEEVRVTTDGVSLGQAVDDEMTALYQQHLMYYSASTVGSLLKAAVCQKWMGAGIRGRGGVYFLPGWAMVEYEKVASEIENADCLLHSVKFKVGSDDKTTRTVLLGFREDVKALIAEINGDVFGETEMRERGIDSRIQRMTELTERVQFYQQLFSCQLGDLSEAIDATQSALQMAKLAKVSA